MGDSPIEVTPTWKPDPDSGLSGDRYLNEAIAQHADDLSDAHSPGVYVLELSTPETTSYETLSRLWLDVFDTTPDYLETIADSDRLIYVGATPNVYERLEEHLQNPDDSTVVAEVFPIHSILDVQWFDDRGRAFDRENGIAMELANQHPEDYIHSR